MNSNARHLTTLLRTVAQIRKSLIRRHRNDDQLHESPHILFLRLPVLYNIISYHPWGIRPFQPHHERSNTLTARSYNRRYSTHTHHSRPSRSEQGRLSARIVRRPAHPRVRTLRQRRARQTEIVRGAERS